MLVLINCRGDRFDWFLKSRTPIEIGRRCTTLVSLVDKEYADEDEKKGKGGPGGVNGKGKRKIDLEDQGSNTSRASTPAIGGGGPATKKARK